jgi:pyridoxine 5-phosphate synthase
MSSKSSTLKKNSASTKKHASQKRLLPPTPCKLSVNVNKIATLRNSRGGDTPNLLSCVKDIILFGAEGITVHPRPDERHIRRKDVYDLRDLLQVINKSRKTNKVEFNIEGYPSSDFLKMVQEIHPDQVTLVPDAEDAITSNAGWELAKNEKALTEVVQFLKKNHIRCSLFIDVFKFSKAEAAALARIKPERVELYTEKFAKDYDLTARKVTTEAYLKVAAEIYKNHGIAINAGHDLNSKNVRFLLKQIPEIIECSIGHALMSEALYLGLESTIQLYLFEMSRARSINKS